VSWSVPSPSHRFAAGPSLSPAGRGVGAVEIPLSLQGMRRWAAPRAAQPCPGDRATCAWTGAKRQGEGT
jgi:hypothetical protein